MLLLSGCGNSTKYKPIVLPNPVGADKCAVEYLATHPVPECLVNSYFELADQGNTLELISEKAAVTRTSWSFMSILGGVWSAISGFFTGW